MMKGLLISLLLCLGGTCLAAELSPIEKLELCLKDCLEYSQPGYELKQCLYQCQKDFSQEKSEYCNTDEEDCDRDDSGI